MDLIAVGKADALHRRFQPEMATNVPEPNLEKALGALGTLGEKVSEGATQSDDEARTYFAEYRLKDRPELVATTRLRFDRDRRISLLVISRHAVSPAPATEPSADSAAERAGVLIRAAAISVE